jgi:hypothetical protein
MKCIKCGKEPSWWQPQWIRVCDCSQGVATSELDEIQFDELSDEDYIMISDISKKSSLKVSLATLKKFIKS